MQRTGDYFRPMFNGRPYPDKPVGSYWLVLWASRWTGGIDELAARLPSAVSAVAAVVFLMLIGCQLYGYRVALLAGSILATSFGFTVFARTASADAENVAGVLAALWLFVRHEGRAGHWLFLFWLVMALTSLTKGLLGFALPLSIAGVYSTWIGLADSGSNEGWFRRMIAANGWLFNRMTLLAAPLAIGVYFAPFLLSPAGPWEGLAMVFRENVRRFYDPVNHRGPVYLYAYVIFELLVPWSVLLPAALLGAMSTALRGHGHCQDMPTQSGGHGTPKMHRFALIYFWSTFLFFTLSASRRSYYLLPILPAAALLIAVALTQPSRLRLIGIWLFAAVVLIAPVVLVPPEWRPAPLNQWPPLPSRGAFIAVWIISIAALGIGILRYRRVTAALVVTAFAFQSYLVVFLLPAMEINRTQRPFAEAVRARLGPDMAGLALYRTRDIVFYLNPPGPLPELREPADLQNAAAAAIRWVILRRRDRDGARRPLDRGRRRARQPVGQSGAGGNEVAARQAFQVTVVAADKKFLIFRSCSA